MFNIKVMPIFLGADMLKVFCVQTSKFCVKWPSDVKYRNSVAATVSEKYVVYMAP